MKPYVKAKKVWSEPAISGFFKAWLTLGAADWNHNFTITCGKCEFKFEKIMHSQCEITECPCCGIINRWDKND